MHFIRGKIYPLIGARTEIPGDDLPCLNPVTGHMPIVEALIPVDKINGMFVQNIRGKLILTVMNESSTEDLIITPLITRQIQGFGINEPSITVPANTPCFLGTFSANYETAEGQVEIDFEGDGHGIIWAWRIP